MQNEMRNRLVELVQDALFQHAHYVGKERRRALEAETEAEHSEIYESIKTLQEFIADHLIENGVIVPPCKLGSEIYMLVTRHTKSFEWENKKMFLQNNQHTFIKETTFTKSNFFKVIEQFGKTVFLTKEEAEQKLRKEDEGK